MSVNPLQQELQTELTTTNRLLHLISEELLQIKEFTSPGASFDTNIKENASTMEILGSLLTGKLDIENIAPVRSNDNVNMDTGHEGNNLHEEQNTLKDNSNIDESG